MFGTSGVRGPVGEDVTAALALSIGRAVGTDVDAAVVGRDARDSGVALQSAVVAGLLETGADVIEVGQAATPTVARAVGTREADAGIVVTASHNPPEDNGLKLWTPSGQAFSPERQDAVAARIREEAYDLAAWDGHGDRSSWAGAAAAHRETLVAAGKRAAPEGSEEPLAELTVVVDVGNGMGRVSADALAELGASVETLNAQADGAFPGRPSEPTAENCETLARTVGGGDADLGIAHDGDADRMMAVAGDGTFLGGDVLLAIFGREAAGDGDRVAAPVDTSLAVDDALAAVGAEVVHTPVGDVHVAARAAEDGVVFGGEPSGAWIFPEETLCPDGPLAAVRLAALAAANPLTERVAAIDQYPIRRDAVETDAKGAAMERIEAAVADRYDDVSTLDGVRVSTDRGWFLLRPSGTQPLVRVTAEGRKPEDAEALLETARGLVTDAVAAVGTQ